MRTELALQHLALRLGPVNRALRAAVARQARQAARLIRPDVAPLCVTDDQVSKLLDDADALLGGTSDSGVAAGLSVREAERQEALRTACRQSGARLPLDELAASLELSAFEEQAILLCAAPELDRAYERIYAYILDDLSRRHPCVELLSSVTADSLRERVACRHAIGRYGKLRRYGVLRAAGEAATELRQELRLASGLFDFLTGNGAPPQFFDPAEVRPPAVPALPPAVDGERLARLVAGLREGWISVLGIWGPRHAGCDEVALAVAAKLGRPLRRVQFADLGAADGSALLSEALDMASALKAIVWLGTDPLAEPDGARSSAVAVEGIAATSVPIVLTGTRPWRPTRVIGVRDYAEIELEAPNCACRERLWAAALPEADVRQVHGLAARYRIGPREVSAAARFSRTRARLNGNGHADALHDHLEAACAAVSRALTSRFATVVRPKRGPDDLVLPRGVHDQVLEVAHFFRAWPRVAEHWGFGRLETGAGGIKALFTGDSGTGKTLAAEVIAGELRMPLLKVDLAQIVSKWVGETEKHLESAFREAEDSHGVLFFDEADALFGKRGEVQHGVDRYANLEVSYLLQRLEDHAGLVILASNLKDNIDSAFTRRFQIVIHFPRPEPAERRRIWQIAFPDSAPLEEPLDLDVVSRLDITGAGIVGSARTAALLAASEGREKITRSDMVRAIARQYRREARVLMPSELGPYAGLLREA